MVLNRNEHEFLRKFQHKKDAINYACFYCGQAHAPHTSWRPLENFSLIDSRHGPVKRQQKKPSRITKQGIRLQTLYKLWDLIPPRQEHENCTFPLFHTDMLKTCLYLQSPTQYFSSQIQTSNKTTSGCTWHVLSNQNEHYIFYDSKIHWWQRGF